jgi:hypothetical protein
MRRPVALPVPRDLGQRLIEIVRGTDQRQMDGAFDKTGLPDPLPMTFYFSVTDDRIVQMFAINNKT